MGKPNSVLQRPNPLANRRLIIGKPKAQLA
jgi:hypothetical protein